MNLVIDFGNTLRKFAIFEKNEIIKIEITDTTDSKQLIRKVESLVKIIGKSSISSAIIVSVIDYPEDFKNYLAENFHSLEFSHHTPIPINNQYKTPETLGKDRLAAAVAANNLFPGNNVLAVIAGTCITYEIVDANKNYRGGAISPGIRMRFDALHNFTHQLPLLDSTDSGHLTGGTTQDSIVSGVVHGTIAEVDGMIEKFRRNYENLTIILSGGNMNYFDKKLKNNIFAVPNLVLRGLNIILEFNEHR